ncbi:type II toxin-antitoxin system Phd/YefM family antitoxin [Spiribacter aquaticus]|uniref:Type II toxin-antitoxin system Phd/YefM family antitoxin n=1 Tax=Spiribacter aquaticus TaxID=1935996 RepID=A0A557RM32_9GAMM|nr:MULTISPECIES: prevent-host-death protein [Spiribacter]KAF0279274.1 prevent-host-death protein [Spiribacter roseus]PYZ99556.1 type II toxin-antitoxin system Phd/YefM family antitoxin [Gammaproteobacteria bacterium 2W06]TVO66234.1 type II toxin-antitoxin system Phd/YefM family antitoxin [Spiribacter aquaticus]
MSELTANELKTRGVSAIEDALKSDDEAMVSVRGERRYVVMDMTQYTHLRECELEAALAESRADLGAGRFVRESAEAHVERLSSKG